MNIDVTTFNSKTIRHTIENSKADISFGISYLDDAMPIMKTDLIVISAQSGSGKSEIAAHIAAKNAIGGKNVFFFALEAHEQEIQTRVSYKFAAKKYFDDTNRDRFPVAYDLYISNTIDKRFMPYAIWGEEEAEKIYKNNFRIAYRKSEKFGADEFIEAFKVLDVEADLIVCDHLQYFDYDMGTEYASISRIIKAIRDMVLLHQVPVILVSHISTPDNRAKKIIADQYALHGTSNIAKTATKIIIVDRDPTTDTKCAYRIPSLFRIAKNRFNSSTSRYVAKVIYNLDYNAYEGSYKLARLKNFDTELVDVLESERPHWAKQGVFTGEFENKYSRNTKV